MCSVAPVSTKKVFRNPVRVAAFVLHAIPLRDGARRMAEAAIHLVDELLPLVPVRQFVITFPVQLRDDLQRIRSTLT